MTPHVVIVGAGFGGLYAARALRRAQVRVTVIDRRNHHLFQPLLYQTATALLAPSEIAWPIRWLLRRRRDVTTLLGEVVGVDAATKRVFLKDGDAIAYDALVLATGARHSYFGHDEWAPYAPGLKTLEDATAVRGRILSAFEKAEREEDEAKRRALLTFVVVGAGPIGLGVMLFSRLRGAMVTAIDGRADRLDFAREHIGVAATVPLGDGDEAALTRLTEGEYFDVVFDATGNPQAMERGFRFIAHGGRYVLVSIVQGDIRFSDPEFHKREATLLSSRNATTEDFETVMRAMREGLVPDAALATHRLTLADVPAGFSRLLDPAEGVIKAIVEC